jgi:RHS repeat-associated protein
VSRAYLDPFGDKQAGSGEPRHLFTDQERDAETGLDYFGARYYDAWVGRFLEQDPELGGPTAGTSFERIAGNIANQNPYAYALNQPTLFVDPSGRSETTYWLVPTVTGTRENGAQVTIPFYSMSGGLQAAVLQATEGGTQSTTPAAVMAAGTVNAVGFGQIGGAAGQSTAVAPEASVVGPAPQEVGVGSFLARVLSLVARSSFLATRLPWLAGPGGVAAAKFASDPARAALIQRLVASDGSLRVSNTVAQRMATAGRFVPNDAILRVVGSGTRGVDPRGAAGHFMYRGPGVSPHGNLGTLEVLVNEQIGVINHVLFKSGPK